MTRYFFDSEFLEDGRTIELISIGIVAEDGREFYAEVKQPAEVWSRVFDHEWLVANVVPHLTGEPSYDRRYLADEIQQFVTGNKPSFWAYCGAYDWVALNQLYGPMVNHPTKWPFYCNDIAQLALHKGVNRRSLPKQEGDEHHALADARWNRDVYNWLTTGRFGP